MDDFTNAQANRETKLLMTDGVVNPEAEALWYGDSEEEPGSHIPANHVLISDLDGNSSPVDFRNTLDSIFDPIPMWSEPNWLTGDHNTPRVGFRYGEKRHDGIAIISLLLPGPNTIYYVRHQKFFFVLLPYLDNLTSFRVKKSA